MSNCLFTRIENRVGLGTPDVLIAVKNRGFVLVELKVVKRGRQVRLSPHQIAFHARHAGHGCPTYILVLHAPTGKRVHECELLLYAGDQAIRLHEGGIDVSPLRRWNWGEVQWEILRGVLTGDVQV
jgi:hypothetical protein